MNGLLPRSCVHKNDRTKGEVRGQRSSASFKFLHSTYLAIAGVGPILLKPWDDVPEGKKTQHQRGGGYSLVATAPTHSQ